MLPNFACCGLLTSRGAPLCCQILLMSLSPKLRRAIRNLANTVALSKLVFVLGTALVTVASVTSVVVLRDPTGATDDGLGRGFRDFRSSFLTMFVFILTGEVCYPPPPPSPSLWHSTRAHRPQLTVLHAITLFRTTPMWWKDPA